MSYNSKYTGAEVEALLDAANGKQDKITDLDAIRSGAAAGATALQSVPAEYVTETELTNKGYVTTSALDDKVDKVTGKQLSTEDFTTALKEKLEGLSNYNDEEISAAVSSLQIQIDYLVSGNANDAINSFNEIIAFLDGVKDTQDLAGIIASIETQIAAKQATISDLDTIRAGAALGATALQSVPEGYITEDELMWTKTEGEAGVRLKGTNGTATGNLAISAGDDKTASDGTLFTSAASGDHAVAFGFGNTCSGRTTLAQGLYNTVSGKDSVAFGQRNTVNGDQAFAAGQQNEVTTRLGVTLGYQNKATNTNSIAIGYKNTSSGSGSVALGDTCESGGTSSTAMGYNTKATGAYSATFGENTQATNRGEVAMGSYNKSTTSTDASEQTAFSFGIGTSDTDRTNALEIKKNGDVYIGDKSLATVATSGSYNDLSNKPTIPSAVTESTVSGWGFTKNTGTYSKPSGGIPKTDLASDVQLSLSKADDALQEQRADENYIKKNVWDDLVVAEADGFFSNKAGLHFALPNTNNGDDDDVLLSRESVKTINGESILGGGDLTIGGDEDIIVANKSDLDELYKDVPEGTKAVVVNKTSDMLGVNLFDCLMGTIEGFVEVFTQPEAYTLKISSIDTNIELPISDTEDVAVELPFKNPIVIGMGSDLASVYRILVKAGFSELVWVEGHWSATSYMINNEIPVLQLITLDDNATSGLVAIAPSLIVDFVGAKTITEYIKNGDNWEVWSEGKSGLNTQLNAWSEHIAQLLPTKTSQLENDSNFITSDGLKTINGQSLLGSGDIVISGGEGGGTDLTENDDITVRDINARDITADSLYGKVYADVISDSYGTKALSIINEGILIQGHANNEVILQTVTSGSGTKFLSDDGTYKTISGGGSGEDIRYFTDFTVEDFIEACENGDTITYDTTELFNAMKSNKVICVPYRGYDKGFIVASYKSGEDEEYQSMYLQKGDIEYYAWTGDSHELVGELPTYNSVQVVEVAGGEVFLTVLDNHIYRITDQVDYLLPFFNNIQKGSTIHFMSGEVGTTIEMYNALWANGEIPQIEPNTYYELSIIQNASEEYNAILTPFKLVE